MPYLKPSSCIGCPFYHHGTYFTPDTMVKGSKVLFLAQNPGPDEEEGLRIIQTGAYANQDIKESVRPQPLIGRTGQLFDKRFLPLSGLKRSEVSLANAIRCRPGESLGLRADALPGLPSTVKLETSDAEIVKALKHCREAHLKIPSSVRTIVTMGRYAMFALTGIQNEDREYGKKQGVMESWRGYAVDVPNFNSFHTVDTSNYHRLDSEYRIFFTMHIAALFRGDNKKFFHATLEDFNKLKNMLNGTWPKPLPTWSVEAPAAWPTYAAFDTEYIPEGNVLIRWSLTDVKDITRNWCVEAYDTPSGGIPIQEGSTVLLQNAHADIVHLRPIVDFSRVKLHDMMYAHFVLWTGEPHNLNFIQSKYGSANRHKHLMNNDPQLYSVLDTHEPAYMWKHHFVPEFKKDRASLHIYQDIRLKLIDIIERADKTGSRLNNARLREVKEILEQNLEGYIEQAKLLTGDPAFKLGGQTQIKRALYDDVYIPDPVKVKKVRKKKAVAQMELL